MKISILIHFFISCLLSILQIGFFPSILGATENRNLPINIGPGITSGGNGIESLAQRIKILLLSEEENGIKFNLKRYLETALDNVKQENSQASHASQAMLSLLESQITETLLDLESRYSVDYCDEYRAIFFKTEGIHESKSTDKEAFTSLGEHRGSICFDANLIAAHLFSLISKNKSSPIIDDVDILIYLETLTLHEHFHHHQTKPIFKSKKEFSAALEKLEAEAQAFAFLVLSFSIGRAAHNPTYIENRTMDSIIKDFQQVNWVIENDTSKSAALEEIENILGSIHKDLEIEKNRLNDEVNKMNNLEYGIFVGAILLAALILGLIFVGLLASSEVVILILIC
jgi:hypothetical protein